jgi:hypothetical protein
MNSFRNLKSKPRFARTSNKSDIPHYKFNHSQTRVPNKEHLLIQLQDDSVKEGNIVTTGDEGKKNTKKG